MLILLKRPYYDSIINPLEESSVWYPIFSLLCHPVVSISFPIFLLELKRTLEHCYLPFLNVFYLLIMSALVALNNIIKNLSYLINVAFFSCLPF